LRERNEREAAISYFFPASSNLCLCEREERKNNFTHEAVLEISVWQKNSSQQFMKLL
jgi:hypothetical protein